MKLLSQRRAPLPAAAPPIAQSLLVWSTLLASFALVLSIVAAQLLVYEPARRSLAAAELTDAADRVEAQLRTIVQRVEAIATLRRDWGSSGLIDLDRVPELVRFLGPLLTRGPNVSSMAIANDAGREILLLHGSDGRYMTRHTDPDHLQGKAVMTTWLPGGGLASAETVVSDYDARKRPWFIAAQAEKDPTAVVWTEPFVFRSTQMPGMSAVVRWTSPQGQRYTSTTDITLLDLSRFTGRLAVGRHGFATVLTPDGRVVGLPRDARFASEAALKSAVLQHVPALGMPVLTAGYALWRANGLHGDSAERFEVAGTPWLGTFRRITLGSQVLWVGAFAPESDFAVTNAAQLTTLAAIVLFTLGLVWLVTRSIAKRFASPLQALAAESERIGRLELDEPVRVEAAWQEVAASAQAHEVMRTKLLQATRGLEAAVQQRTAELTQARDAAEAGTRAKAMFLANMSHEIRTPMNAISGLTQLLQRTPLSGTQKDYVGKIEDAAALLLHIVNDVLDYSKIEAGKLSVEHTEFMLDDLLRRVTQIIAPSAHERSLELVVRRAPQLPNVLVGDPVRLEQILVNLAGNAVKFTLSGEVFIGAELLDQAGDSTRIRFTVRDSGIGMTEEQIQGLFQSFNQGDASMARRFGGTGLGLAISKKLVELMHGDIEVESRPGSGSSFRITLPLERAKGALETLARRAHSLAGMRALVVDDNETARMTLAEILRSFDMEVDVAGDGPSAIAAFGEACRNGLAPQLVLVDWRMPVMDGFEVIQALRSEFPDAQTLFIMVTAAERLALEERITAERLAGYVLKPATPSSLLDAIISSLGASAPAAPTSGAAARGAVPHAGQRVLIVEDNEVNRIVAKELLKAFGVDAMTASSGGEAITRIRGGERFDLIFMDVQMGGMDGLQTTRILRSMPEGKDLVIVALTAHAMPADRAHCIAAGMDDYVAKPISADDLAACLRRWLPAGP
ncbi:MAG TPA: response regulator [Methylibium sp.]